MTLADHLPDIIGRVDRQFRYVFINCVVKDITGRAVAEHLGRTDDEVGYPAALCRLWRRQYQEVFDTGRPNELEFSLASPRGLMQFNKRAVPELDADGTVESVVFIVSDITSLTYAAAERASHRRVLAGINRIFGTVVAGDSEAEFAATCLAVAEELTGSAVAWIGDIDANGQLREIAGSGPAWGDGGPQTGEDGSPPDAALMDAIRDQVLVRGQSLFSNGLPARPGGAMAPADRTALPSFLGVPLKRRGRVIGMLAVGDRIGGYGLIEQAVLEALAPAIAEALSLRRTEAALRQSDERMRVLVEATAQAVWETNAGGELIVDSPSWRAYTGQTLESSRGFGWVDVIHPDERDAVESAWRAAVAAGAVFGAEYRLRGPDGGWRWTSAHAAPIRGPDGQVLKWVGMNVDITARKEAEAALEAAREQAEVEHHRLQAVLEATPLAVALVDADSRRVLFENRRAIELQGADHGGLDLNVHAAALRVLRPDGTPCPSAEWPVNRSIESGRVVHQQEMAIRRADGTVLPVLVSTAPVLDAAGRVAAAVAVFDDISERKAAEVALAELNHALEARVAEARQQADQLRALATQLTRVEQRERQRLARVLHDHLQQLIVAAQIQSATMLRDTDPERLRTAASAVQEALQEALNVSRSLTVELSPPVLREAGLIGALDWLAERMADQHDFEVTLRADRRAEPDNEELRFLLFECARELLLNAAKHSAVGSADLALRRPHRGALQLIVGDEGRGFDPKVVTGRRPGATSFGLFSIQERLAYIGGRMEIASAPGRGTRVTLFAPVTTAPADTEAAAAAPPVQPAKTVEVRRLPDAWRVLVVDDHAIMRQGLAGLFQFEPDIEVVGEAADGAQAVELAADLRPDVVIMDVNLGRGIDGIEATRRILADNPQVRVIGLSMHVDSAVAAAMHDAGAERYLTKGGPCEELFDAIRGREDA